MFKKLSVILLSLSVAFSSVSVFADTEDEKLSLLSSLGIMEGYEDGSFRLDNPLTRAEFTKITVAASDCRKEVSSMQRLSPFPDVPHTLWSAPYIALAAKAGYVNGYLDATFHPDAYITYAEATAVFLRLLGYDNSDFGTNWPAGHMAIAEDIGLTDGIYADPANAVSRRDTATLLYNLLDQNIRNTNTEYITKLSCNSVENVVIMATNAEDTAVSADKVVTSAGKYKKGSHFSEDWIGRTGELFLEDGDKILTFVPDEQTTRSYTVTGTAGHDLLLDGTIYNFDDNMTVYYKSAVTSYAQAYADGKEGASFTLFYDADGSLSYALLRKAAPSSPDSAAMRTYAVYSTLGDGVITYKNGVMEKLLIDDGITVYDGDKPAGALIKSQLKMGDILKVVYDEDGDVDYVILDTNGVKGPYTAAGDAWSDHFPVKSSTAIMRDGTKVDKGAIEAYDILYYSAELDMILAYSDKITGVYRSASPSKDTPSTINVSGTNYEIESVEAFNKLAGGGRFAYGDTVTLLLGREGKIADVLTTDATASSAVGVVLATGTTMYETNLGDSYSGYFISITRADGKSYTYEADKDYESLLNSVAALSFSDGKASAKPAAGSDISGYVDASASKIGQTVLAPNVKILDVYAPSAYDGGSAASVFLQRLDGVNLSASKILYAARDNQNRITELILNDVTGDLHKYGIVTKAQNQSMGMLVSGNYTYNIEGSTGSYMTNGKSFSVSTGNPAQFSFVNGQIYSITRLSELTGTVAAITADYIRMQDGSQYDISDASIYRYGSDYTYTLLKPGEASPTDYTLRAYYDKSASAGGRVRVIIATPKP